MKKLYSILMVAMLGLLAACGGNDTSSSDDEKGMKLAKKGKFTYAASGEFKPFSVTDGSGKMTGFDIDVAEAVAKELGLEPVQQKFKFASIVEGVKSGRFDAAVASHAISDDRKKHVDFSTPYYYSGPQVFVRPGDKAETLDDLKGKEIAVAKGSTYAKDAEKVTDNIVLYDSDVTALEALGNNRHDAVITDFITGKEAIAANIKVEGKELLGRSEQAIAVGKGNDELLQKINEAIDTLRENGTLKEISEKYFDEDITTVPEN